MLTYIGVWSCCTFSSRTLDEVWPSINVLAWLCYESKLFPAASDFSSTLGGALSVCIDHLIYMYVYLLYVHYVIATRTIQHSGASRMYWYGRLSCLMWQYVAHKRVNKQKLCQSTSNRTEPNWTYQNTWFQSIPQSHSTKNSVAQERKQVQTQME